GWRVVSDDYVALCRTPEGTMSGTTFRKALRVPWHLVERAAGRRMMTTQGLVKNGLDPDVLRPGSFLRSAAIGRIAFLEKGSTRSIVGVSPAETLERLLATCAPALSLGKIQAPFGALADLARRAEARVATLT